MNWITDFDKCGQFSIVSDWKSKSILWLFCDGSSTIKVVCVWARKRASLARENLLHLRMGIYLLLPRVSKRIYNERMVFCVRPFSEKTFGK